MVDEKIYEQLFYSAKLRKNLQKRDFLPKKGQKILKK